MMTEPPSMNAAAGKTKRKIGCWTVGLILALFYIYNVGDEWEDLPISVKNKSGKGILLFGGAGPYLREDNLLLELAPKSSTVKNIEHFQGFENVEYTFSARTSRQLRPGAIVGEDLHIRGPQIRKLVREHRRLMLVIDKSGVKLDGKEPESDVR